MLSAKGSSHPSDLRPRRKRLTDFQLVPTDGHGVHARAIARTICVEVAAAHLNSDKAIATGYVVLD